MSDGVRLSARVWLPASWTELREPVPGILEYIPYRKRDMVRSRDERNHPYFATNGYACVRVDMRGSGDSEGQFTDMYSTSELDDALQIIEWIAAQSWCDGAIGMMGTSWGGTATLQAAASKPAPLKAIIAVCATNNRYEDDIHHMGGCLLTDSIEWGATLPAIIALPAAPDIEHEIWRERWRRRLATLSFPLERWISHETKDDYWRWGSVSETPGAIECPTLAIGGWADRYSNTVMNLVEETPGCCWGIVGPWGHHYPDAGRPEQAMGFQQEALRWWNRWLKGEENSICGEPRLRIWCSEFQPPERDPELRQGRWISELDWPSDNVKPLIRTLPCKRGSQKTGDPDFATVPSDLTVGKCAGDTGYFGRPDGLPSEQSEDDQKSLVLESPPVAGELEILGKVELILDLKTRHRVSNLVVRLCDVNPQGQVSRVTYAIRNLALDGNFEARRKTTADQARRERLVFPNVAYRFRQGHRIRITLSSAYWPMIWPAPEPTQMWVNVRTLQLVLPRRRSSTNDGARPPEPVAGAERTDEDIPARPGIEREVVENPDDGSLCHRWLRALSTTRHEAAGLQIGSETTAEHQLSRDVPTSAKSSFRHQLILSYDDGPEIKAVGEASLSSCSRYFYPKGSIRIIEDGSETFRKDWSFKIERKHS